jgi:hypothetical protein
MPVASLSAVLLLTALVLVPLVLEYADLRRSYGLSRVAALSTTALVVPAFAMASVLTLPLAGHPAAHWLAIVAATLFVYSLAARAIASSASRAETAPSRRTTG